MLDAASAGAPNPLDAGPSWHPEADANGPLDPEWVGKLGAELVEGALDGEPKGPLEAETCVPLSDELSDAARLGPLDADLARSLDTEL